MYHKMNELRFIALRVNEIIFKNNFALRTLLLLAIIFGVNFYNQAQPEVENTRLVVKAFSEHDYESVTSYFDDNLKSKLPVGETGLTWFRAERIFGDFKELKHIKYGVRRDRVKYTIATIAFEKRWIDLELFFDSLQMIQGIFMHPQGSRDFLYRAPLDIASENIIEEDLDLHIGPYLLSAKYCHKNGKSHAPLIVFVHGSGPNDMDESLGATKMFKDLALYFAAAGIPSIRFNKGTNENKKYFKERNDSLTIDMEVTDEVLQVIADLKKQKLVPRQGIILLGHSLGGMMAPRIASRSKDIKALILVGAPARPMEDYLTVQHRYLFSLDSLTADEDLFLTYLNEKIKHVKEMDSVSQFKSYQLPLEMSSTYWWSLKGYDQLQVARQLSMPMLIVNGDKDYNVPASDLELWKEAVGEQFATTISFRSLNHGLIYVEEKSTPESYNEPANTPQYVAQKMIDWINVMKQQRP